MSAASLTVPGWQAISICTVYIDLCDRSCLRNASAAAGIFPFLIRSAPAVEVAGAATGLAGIAGSEGGVAAGGLGFSVAATAGGLGCGFCLGEGGGVLDGVFSGSGFSTSVG